MRAIEDQGTCEKLHDWFYRKKTTGILQNTQTELCTKTIQQK